MSETAKKDKSDPIIPMLQSDFINILVLGGLIGLLVWTIGALLDRYVFGSYFCEGDVRSQCGSAANYAIAAATLVGAIAALGGLVRLRVYRPLLVVIATIIATWGLVQLSWGFSWFTSILVTVILYAVAYGLFSWIARVREFWISLVVMIIVVVAVRLALAV